MKPKILLLLIVWTIVFSVLGISQSVLNEKREFIYKSVRGHDIKANIFLPFSKDKHPVFVYFHGGGFIFGNRDQGLEISLKEKLLANNYAVVSADYRLAPETKLGEILSDVKDVIRWIKLNGAQEFNIDTSRVAAAGGSAGGYLALSTGFDSKFSPDVIVAISSPTGFSNVNIKTGDLTLLNQPGSFDVVKDSVVSYGDYDSRMNLWRFLVKNRLMLYEVFGFDPLQDSGKLEVFKLTTRVRTDYPPTLLVHARNDRLVDLEQVQEFYQFLRNKHILSELYVVENGHSSELINQNPQAVDKIIRFLDLYLMHRESIY